VRPYKDYIPCKDKGSVDVTLLELENRELKVKVRRLEKDIADKVTIERIHRKYSAQFSLCAYRSSL
jgi:hypothetical protein